MTPKELSSAVKEVLMSKPNKGVIFPSFLASLENNGKFVEHCINYITGKDIYYYEGLIKVCQSRIDSMIKSEIEKEEAAIEASKKRLATLKEKVKGV